MMMIDSDGHIERDLQRLDQSDPIPFNEGFQKLKRKRSFKAKYAPTTSIFPPRFPIVTFLSSAFSATKDMTTPEGRQIASLDAAAPLPFPPLPEAAAEPAATIICAFESLVRDDILVQVCGFLFLKDVRSVCQVNSRIRNVLLPPQGGRDDESSLRDDYVWKQQAQFLWNLPMEQQKWTTEMNSRFDDLGGETSPLLSRIQLLSLAHHPIPTEFDASIFTPCRWSRTLRSGTIVVRASLRKELEVIPTADGRGPAVRFLGRTGLGDRSVRTNAPLPRPDRLLWRAKRGAILRNPFARPHLGYSTSSLSANRASSTTPLLPAKWRPFVAPSLSIQSQGGEHLAWNVAPRLLSYFEVELLPPSAAADSASSGMCGRSAAEPMISGDGASSYMSTRTRRPHYEFSIRLDSDAALARHGEDEAQTFGSAFRHSKECVAVGLATEDFSMHTRMPGWDAHSWCVVWDVWAGAKRSKRPPLFCLTVFASCCLETVQTSSGATTAMTLVCSTEREACCGATVRPTGAATRWAAVSTGSARRCFSP